MVVFEGTWRPGHFHCGDLGRKTSCRYAIDRKSYSETTRKCRGDALTDRVFAHQREYRIRLEPGADKRAPGGAVTVALCGHWNHEGPCRWPHFSRITPEDGGHHRLVVEFDVHEDELEMISCKIDAAVGHGQLTSPDGVVSIWSVER